MDLAPYVEVQQLIDLIHLPDFPELALRNILIANPHSGRNPEVLDALFVREPAVSQQTLDDMENSTQTLTAKDIIEADMAMSQQRIVGYLRDLQYYFVMDSLYMETDSLQNLFETRNEADYAMMLAETYTQLGQYTKAVDALNNADKTWWTETQYFTANDLLELIAIHENFEEGESLSNLGVTTRSSLAALQNQTSSPWLYQRINSLLLPYGQGDLDYLEPVFLPASGKTNTPKKAHNQVAKSSFKLHPNPAQRFSILSWNWFEEGINGSFDIHIISMQGKVVAKHKVPDCKTNSKLLPIDHLTPGMYMIEVLGANGSKLFAEKLVVQ
jgi:hypothetical protein